MLEGPSGQGGSTLNARAANSSSAADGSSAGKRSSAAAYGVVDGDGGDGGEAMPLRESNVRISVPDGVQIGTLQLTKNQTLVAGVVCILTFGLALAFAVPPPSSDPHPWDRISAVIGWWYFMAWAISFLPQLYLNWRRKSVVGQSFDYVFMNVLGFLCYSIFNCSFFFNDAVKEDYHRRHGGTSDVQANDVAFALYAVTLCVVNTGQIAAYDRGPQSINKLVVGIILAVAAVYAAWGLVLVVGVRTEHVFNTLDWLYGLSYVKLGVTLIKYIPQVYLNFRRKLTVGWNIWNVLLDFTGGSLSVMQVFIDSGSTGDWSQITGNLAKFLLGSMSMVYDTVFMVQHYCLYADNNHSLIKAEEASDPIAAVAYGDDSSAKV